ncbi:MAG: MBL fold metallo-hydrolase [Flavobacteriales bacterium]|nr:MBL fold metallo-hydrolase [Flavobacteriales bacterium]
MIQIQSLTFNPFAENTFVLFDETKECIIIDPGCYEAHEEETLAAFVANNDLKPVRLINTHCHIDHVLGVAFVAEKYDLGFEFHSLDMPVFESTERVADMYSIPNVKLPVKPTGFLDENDTVEFGHSTLEIMFVPGHAPGHIAFFNREEKFVIGGDVLFYGSIGRTDLPGGDHATLISNIKSKFLPLGDDFTVYSGHGPETNMGFERENNPFLR